MKLVNKKAKKVHKINNKYRTLKLLTSTKSKKTFHNYLILKIPQK